MEPSPLINKDSPFAFLQKQSAGGMQNTIDRTKIEKNWLQKKSSKEYPTFIYYSFELLSYIDSFEKSDENSKEFLSDRIKKLNRENIFSLVKNYEEMPQNQINKLREDLLFEKLNNSKVFILQKLSSHFGNLLYRYVSIDESSEKKKMIIK